MCHGNIKLAPSLLFGVFLLSRKSSSLCTYYYRCTYYCMYGVMYVCAVQYLHETVEVIKWEQERGEGVFTLLRVQRKERGKRKKSHPLPFSSTIEQKVCLKHPSTTVR